MSSLCSEHVLARSTAESSNSRDQSVLLAPARRDPLFFFTIIAPRCWTGMPRAVDDTSGSPSRDRALQPNLFGPGRNRRCGVSL